MGFHETLKKQSASKVILFCKCLFKSKIVKRNSNSTSTPFNKAQFSNTINNVTMETEIKGIKIERMLLFQKICL